MRHFLPLLAAAALVLSTAAAQADLGDQLAKLLANDGAAHDHFGSVAISGATVIVGAVGDDDNGGNSGSAYLFERDLGGPDNWGQVALPGSPKLLPDDGEEGDRFGVSVAISGNTAIVGAQLGDDDEGDFSGSAYIFERDEHGPDNWGQFAELLADDGELADYFGYSVAISGTTAIVGAYADDDQGDFSGSAYIFERDEGGPDNWGQVAKLVPKDGAADDRFGWHVAISGATAVVGANRDDDNGDKSGSAYIFERDEGGLDSWGQVAKLLPKDGAAEDRFGWSVAISGATAIIAALTDDDNGFSSGSAYIFERDEGGPANWGQVAKLLPDDGAEQDFFGISVAISGTTAVVGADRDDDTGTNSGSAYLFNTTTGQQIAKLLPDDGAEQDFFGWGVAISGAIVIVGADRDDDNGTASGSTYLFDAASAPACLWDLSGDGDVGPFDLALLLGDWGPCPEPCEPRDPGASCVADLDGNCDVGPFDLALLLGNWGPCP